MRKPIFVRCLSEDERHQLRASLRSREAFVVRRCQMLLASQRGERAPAIARSLGCDDQTVRDAIRAFNQHGLEALQARSKRPQHTQAAFAPEQAQRLRQLVQQSPRTFGKATSLWTLDLLSEVSFEQGLCPTRVSGETIRATLARLGVRWARAKHWIRSPDPAYARKKSGATG